MRKYLDVENIPENIDDGTLFAINCTPKLNTRAKRIARKRQAREHEYEIVFFGRKAKERENGR